MLAIGATNEEAADISLDVRRRDAERLQLELAEGPRAGLSLLRGNAAVAPVPFTAPSRESRALSSLSGSKVRVVLAARRRPLGRRGDDPAVARHVRLGAPLAQGAR